MDKQVYKRIYTETGDLRFSYSSEKSVHGNWEADKEDFAHQQSRMTTVEDKKWILLWQNFHAARRLGHFSAMLVNTCSVERRCEKETKAATSITSSDNPIQKLRAVKSSIWRWRTQFLQIRLKNMPGHFSIQGLLIFGECGKYFNIVSHFFTHFTAYKYFLKVFVIEHWKNSISQMLDCAYNSLILYWKKICEWGRW